MRRSRLVQAFGLVAAALAIPMLVRGEWLGAAPGLAIAVAFLSGLVAAPFALFAAWRYGERIFQPTTVTVSRRGLEYDAAHLHTITEWESLTRLLESAGFLFMELGPQTLFIPLRIFTPEELATIRRLAAEAGFGPNGRRREGTPR
jgi:hypothetical protein